jgi:hypothetical protein
MLEQILTSAKYHRVTEPNDGVILLEFNRCVASSVGTEVELIFSPPVNAFHDE